MTITKKDLSQILMQQTNLTRVEALNFIEDFFEVIRVSLESGNPVHVANFGNFTLRNKKSRIGRNPKTNEEFEITARRVVSFHPSNTLRAKVNQIQLRK